MSEPAPDAHPLVATPTVLAQGSVLPSARGARPRSGRLSDATLSRLVAIAEAVFSTESGPPPVARMDFLRRELDDFFARGNGSGRLLFTLGPLALSLLAPPLIGRAPGLVSLPVADRVRALTRLEATPLVTVLIAVRAILCILYYEHPDAAREVKIEMGPGR